MLCHGKSCAADAFSFCASRCANCAWHKSHSRTGPGSTHSICPDNLSCQGFFDGLRSFPSSKMLWPPCARGVAPDLWGHGVAGHAQSSRRRVLPTQATHLSCPPLVPQASTTVAGHTTRNEDGCCIWPPDDCQRGVIPDVGTSSLLLPLLLLLLFLTLRFRNQSPQTPRWIFPIILPLSLCFLNDNQHRPSWTRASPRTSVQFHNHVVS